jgi:MFS family permease
MKSWYWSLFPEEMALGLLSVLLPLYIVSEFNGSLIEVSEVAAFTAFASIPSSIFWGYLSDKTEECKKLISLALLFLGCAFFLLGNARNIYELLAFSVVFGIFRSTFPSVAGILIAESNSRNEWSKETARYRFTLRLGNIAGLLAGMFLISSYGYRGLFVLCSAFVFTSFVLSMFLIQDPPFNFERKLVLLEQSIGFINRASFVISDGSRVSQSFIKKYLGKGSSPVLFGFGVLFFSFAAEMIFTPLPIFFFQKVDIPSATVSLLFLINYAGSLLGYLFFEEMVESLGEENGVKVATLFRTLLFPSMLICGYLPYMASLAAGAIILLLLGLSWALFSISSSVLCMNIIPEGKIGVYSGLIELGSAVGVIAGGLVPTLYGFELLFILGGVLSAAALVIFKFGVNSLNS